MAAVSDASLDAELGRAVSVSVDTSRRHPKTGRQNRVGEQQVQRPASGERVLSGEDMRAAVFMSISTMFIMADQNLMAPNLSAIADDLQVDRDMKLGGEIPFAFFIVGGLVALFIGPLADSHDRKYLFVAVVLLGSIPSVLTLFVSSYRQFFWLRVLTGISIGGISPVVFSLFSDIFPPSQRNLASAAFGAAVGIGTALGQAMAGFVGPSYGWRVPFGVVGVPSMFWALVILVYVRDPRQAGKGPRPKSPSAREVLQLFTVKSNVLIFCQSIVGCLPWGVVGTYLNDDLTHRGLSVEAATSLLLVFGIGCLCGLGIGGVIGQRLYNTRKELVALFMAGSTVLGCFPLLYLLRVRWDSAVPTFGSYFIALLGGVSAITGPNIRACLLNVNLPRRRGTVFSIFVIMDDLGKGLGPGLVALLIQTMGRKQAFTMALLGWPACGVFLALLALTLRHDEQTVKAQEQHAEHAV